MLEVAVFVIFAGCMAYSIVSDTMRMTIANLLPAVLVVSFALFSPLSGMEWYTYGLHYAVGAAVLVLTFGLFAAHAMGGGDAKLIAATAIWMGPNVALAQYLVWSAMLGGFLTLSLLALRYSPFAPMLRDTSLFRYVADRKAGIPYGIALGAAGLLAFPHSPLGIWALGVL